MARTQYTQRIFAAAALGGASGRTVQLAGMTSSTLHLVKILWTASATVGARQPTLRVLDGDSNRIYASGTSATITATQTIDVTWTATSALLSAGNTQLAPLPDDFPIPIGAQLQIFDAAAIDNADTVSITAVMTQGG